MGLSTKVRGKRQDDTQTHVYDLQSQNTNVSDNQFGNLLLNDIDSSLSPDMRYMAELDLFHRIETAPHHFIDNPNGVVDFKLAMQILYAMRKSKPVVITALPTFSPDVDLTVRDIIRPHLHQLFLVDAHSMKPELVTEVLKDIPEKVDYRLTDIEDQLARLYGKTYFRDLLTQENLQLAAA